MSHAPSFLDDLEQDIDQELQDDSENKGDMTYYSDGKIKNHSYKENGYSHELFYRDDANNSLANEKVFKDRVLVSQEHYDEKGNLASERELGFLETLNSKITNAVSAYKAKHYQDNRMIAEGYLTPDEWQPRQIGGWVYYGKNGKPERYEDRSVSGDVLAKGSLLSPMERIKSWFM